MVRFFLPSSQLSGCLFAALDGENAVHAKALRLKAGDPVILCDAQGGDYTGTVHEVHSGHYTVAIADFRPSRGEPQLAVSVYMALAKADKLEHVIQKATELGAYEIVAFPSARCVSRPDEKTLSSKVERWQKIAASAAEQCGRGRIPRVLTVISFQQALARAAGAEVSVLLYENEEKRSFRAALPPTPFSTAALMTGPEGGFEPEEVQLARAAGLQICSLGPRILRCETAPLCALSALMYTAGELEER